MAQKTISLEARVLMPTQYITVKQSEPDFLDYLWGRSSEHLKQNQRAIPVKTYNLGTAEELVTFEIKNINDIKKPHPFIFLSTLVKLNSFILILFPLFFVFTKNYIEEKFSNHTSFLLAALASLFLFTGLNIRNDIYDYVSGFDRVNLGDIDKPIRMGWISAHRALQLSLILILISAILAAIVLFYQPRTIQIILFALILFLIGRFVKSNSYKQQHLGEFILFILIGPALVAGYQLALGATIDSKVLSFGTLWGFAVLYLIQVNNFSHIMTSSQSGIKNTMTKLGFDLAQKFLVILWTLFIGFWALFHYHYTSDYWTAVSTILLIFCSIPLYKKILKIKSPMGSGLQIVRQEAHRTFLLMVGIFLMENICYLWVKLS